MHSSHTNQVPEKVFIKGRQDWYMGEQRENDQSQKHKGLPKERIAGAALKKQNKNGTGTESMEHTDKKN